MTTYRVEIDRSLCVGHGGCVREAPGVFSLEDGIAVALQASNDLRALEAAELCSVGAITVYQVRDDELAA